MERKFEHFKLVILDYIYMHTGLVLSVVGFVIMSIIYCGYNLNLLHKTNLKNSDLLSTYKKNANMEYVDAILKSKNVWGLSPYHQVAEGIKSIKSAKYFADNKHKCSKLLLNKLIESIHQKTHFTYQKDTDLIKIAAIGSALGGIANV